MCCCLSYSGQITRQTEAITCTLQHKQFLLQLSVKHDIRSSDSKEQYTVIDVVRLHWQLLEYISSLPV